MRNKRRNRIWKVVFKIILPLTVLVGIFLTVLIHQWNMNAEIPVDYTPGPSSLEGCKLPNQTS